MNDLSHLNALNAGLSHERARLAKAKTAGERELRAVWVAHRGVRRLRDDERVYLVEGSICGAMRLEQAVDFLMAS